jgi:hypothetical protein
MLGKSNQILKEFGFLLPIRMVESEKSDQVMAAVVASDSCESLTQVTAPDKLIGSVILIFHTVSLGVDMSSTCPPKGSISPLSAIYEALPADTLSECTRMVISICICLDFVFYFEYCSVPGLLL